MLNTMKRIAYEERLRGPGLISSEERCLGGGRTRVYNVLNGEEEITRDLLLTVSHSHLARMRGHYMKPVAVSLK